MTNMTERRKILGLKRLLVATDLSSRAEKALARAVRLVEEHGATLSVVHILTGALGNKTERLRIASQIEKDLLRNLEDLSLKKKALVSVRVLSGTPFVEIIRQARQETADLIIVGAHGKDFMKDLLLGTTTEKIVRKGDRSVLVVNQAPHSSYSRVLVGVDFSDNSRRALELALRLAPHAEFHVLHVYSGSAGMLRGAGVTDEGILRYQRQVAKDARQQMNAFLETVHRGRKRITREVWNGQPRREITKIAKVFRADLIAVGTAGRAGIPYILLGSVAEHVMREARCDVLVVRSGSVPFELP
jgi:nucleotide-binding universal stress UspA family protein